MSEFFDDAGNYIGPSNPDPGAARQALKLHQSLMRNQPHDRGINAHHSTFTNIKTDELLYRANLLSDRELHRDAEPGQIYSSVEL